MSTPATDSTPLIIGLSIGGVALLAVGTGVAVCIVLRRNRHNSEDHQSTEMRAEQRTLLHSSNDRQITWELIVTEDVGGGSSGEYGQLPADKTAYGETSLADAVDGALTA